MGFVKTIEIGEYIIDLYEFDGEWSAFVEEFPALDVTGFDEADLMENLYIALTVESELDRLWYGDDYCKEEYEQ